MSAPAAEAVAEGPAPALDTEKVPSGHDRGDGGGDDRHEEIKRLRKRHKKGLLAALLLMGGGGAFLTAGAELVKGGPSGVVSRQDLNAGVGIGIVGGTMVLASIIPAVIARRAKRRADALESSLVLTPSGWVGRGTAGVALNLRF